MSNAVPPDGPEATSPPACALGSLEPDGFAAVCEHLQHDEVAALASSCAALRHAVASNDRLWSSLYARQFPEPWQRLTQPPASLQQHGGAGGGLRSTGPASREWTTDTTPVHLVSLHGSGARRLTLAAQGGTLEMRCTPSPGRLAPDRSIQCYGHSARVSAAAVLDLGGAVRRAGIVTASHDQTIRLWSANVDPAASYYYGQAAPNDSHRLPLTLLTPLRTLRGHQEAVTSLQLVAGSTGAWSVTIAATGGKDRTVRLWGLAPLLASPVQKPQIATLRGHGAPITCLAMAVWQSGGGSALLLSGSLDSRVKAWDPWTAACTGTAKCAAPVAAMQPVAACPALQPHGLLVSGGSGAQLLDLRCMKAVAAVALPPDRAEQVHCLGQHGWNLAVGSSDGARVYDLRVLSSSAGATSSGSSGGGSSRDLPERLRLAGHARPVTAIHVDRLKVVTATDRNGEAPVRVWCSDSGECLAELDSCLPPAAPPSSSGAPADGPGGSEEQQAAAEAEPGGPQGAASAAAYDGQEGAAGSSQQPPQRQYRRGWAGVTALACRGGVLVTGNSDGNVAERDFSKGGLPELERSGGEAGLLAGKFWQYHADRFKI
ncbi:hypothetical protein CHLNCDRAFT_138440 [Chlorella variabilis]|uniref:Uncharacterized protein n=1 Tax=Chlorella variabilis TaxID=554065 RepID=E1ZN22_CHLVA|nr:hypothetical protein CHLNCDRAFT_138440 [Chlorella variabilis]EFN52794.1 hypothetical protein CHLNCDRAFT_138440 [Chlorella variabilis]|eukprot:XP_005844896.1 hypothetical protein CHLNCDRAFT_138440 [Chlorella variabilis]